MVSKVHLSDSRPHGKANLAVSFHSQNLKKNKNRQFHTTTEEFHDL